MNKITVLITCVSLGSLSLTGCQPGQNTPGATMVGAAAGGLVASRLFHGEGSAAGIIAGALIGGVIGNQYGKYMDRQDRANMRRAIAETPVGSQASWTNNNTNAGPINYSVTPVRNYHAHNNYCREYQTRVTIGGEVKTAYGKACRKPDGQWKLMNS